MILRRAWLYVSRNWKRSLILILILTVLLSALAVVFPTWRASMQAQEDLAASLGESFCVKWGINQLTHPHLYESYPSKDGYFTLYRYIGDDYMKQEVLDEILAIDGVVDYTQMLTWYVWFGDLTLKPGLYNVDYADATPETEINYDFIVAGRNMCTLYGINDSSRHEYVVRGSVELVEGRHVQPDDVGCVVISKDLAQRNDLSIGDTIEGRTLQVTLDGTGGLDRYWDIYELEIVGLFVPHGPVDTIMHANEDRMIENQMFCDITTMQHIHRRIEEMSDEASPEDKIGGELIFYVDDPAKLEDIMAQVRAIDIVDMSVFDVDLANPSYAASIQPLRAMRGVMTVLCAAIAAAVLLILRFVLKIWFQTRKKELGILLSLGVSKKRILGQLLVEMLLILSVALVGAGLVTVATVDKTGNFLYSLTANDDGGVNDEQYEKATNVWGTTFDNDDPFLTVPDYSPDTLTVELKAADLLLCFAAGTAATLLITVSCCLPIVRQKPRQILSSL